MQSMPNIEARGILSPQHLHVFDGGAKHYGGNQIWYPAFWQRQAGCGPTVAATLCAYLAKTRPDMAALCPYDSSKKSGFLRLMQDVWKYVTPNMRGSSVEIFTSGIMNYAQSKGVALQCDVLDVPKQKQDRPSIDRVAAFFSDAFYEDLPVAFQNYSNGELKNLEAWHWVTLVSFNPVAMTAQMYDQSRRDDIDIDLYLKTATNAGKFVVARPVEG
ncbi:hypothetical protein LJC27_00595 [Christensenellaceae bacterium OttesenSCG-928-M15]|nr:hypothetical protein [Christensenellaceae bacterium OttesenSCG-928-M15]